MFVYLIRLGNVSIPISYHIYTHMKRHLRYPNPNSFLFRRIYNISLKWFAVIRNQVYFYVKRQCTLINTTKRLFERQNKLIILRIYIFFKTRSQKKSRGFLTPISSMPNLQIVVWNIVLAIYNYAICIYHFSKYVCSRLCIWQLI